LQNDNRETTIAQRQLQNDNCKTTIEKQQVKNIKRLNTFLKHFAETPPGSANKILRNPSLARGSKAIKNPYRLRKLHLPLGKNEFA